MRVRVDVGVACDLRGEMRLSGSAAEQAAQQTILHVHIMHMLLNFALYVAHIGTLLS